jgi:hypothetical protein
MTDGLEAQAAAAAREIIDLDVDQLYGELEIRRRMLADDARIAGSFDVVGEERASVSASLTVLSRMGRDFFGRLNRDLYDIVCGAGKDSADIRSKVLKLITDDVSVTAYLATCAVVYLGIAPPIATVLAVLVTKLILKNAKETICAEWKASLSVA